MSPLYPGYHRCEPRHVKRHPVQSERRKREGARFDCHRLSGSGHCLDVLWWSFLGMYADCRSRASNSCGVSRFRRGAKAFEPVRGGGIGGVEGEELFEGGDGGLRPPDLGEGDGILFL